ncbi:MAG: hypothetical protein GW861_08985 [Deltaproteobacteria bacterium]|nr:hypothetical protein [Deltaproteobacteria bacterium]
MAEYEYFIKLPDSQYGDGVMLNKYQETYSLIAAKKGQGEKGTVYMTWCYPQLKGNTIAEKAIPMKITLGGRQTAINILKEILAQLEGTPKAQVQLQPKPEPQLKTKTGDVPF